VGHRAVSTVAALALALIAIVLVNAPLRTAVRAQEGATGAMFREHGDVGTVVPPGMTTYDLSTHSYRLTASGENIWGTKDAFQFAWKKMSGDVALAADISFVEKGVNPHRKAVLMFRKTLDADSPYVDVALHGSGLTALQYRETKGGITTEIETLQPIYVEGIPLTENVTGAARLTYVDFGNPQAPENAGKVNVQVKATTPMRLRIEKRGGYAYLYIGNGSKSGFGTLGASIPVPFDGEFYVGIGLSSHDAAVTETAIFSNVTLEPLAAAPPSAKPVLYSTLQTVAIDSTIRSIAYVMQGRLEAPNWTRDGSALLYNSLGRLWRLPVGGTAPATPTAIDTGFATELNNDHGISPDGTELAISDNSQETHDSLVYTLPIGGGTPKRITKNSPSYWHGWSPDGSTLAFVGERNGDFDIYTLPVTAASSADEKRLTTAKGLDDGPEYTPDGKWIYFNSERTGHMQIWRMRPDGSGQEQVTHDEWNDWFPHFSPDGKWMVMLSYDSSVTGHPENKNVMLRLMSMDDQKITVLARLYGGQGTINVPSWAPDSKRLAFVSYELLPPDEAK
jgi:TolB protein